MKNNKIINFTQNSLCLNEENNFKNHLIPRKLDLGNDNIDCSFFCHLYFQLILEKPLKIRFNPRCRQNLGSLQRISANKDIITYFDDTNIYDFIDTYDFNEAMCKPYNYYSCNYSKNYTLLTALISDDSFGFDIFIYMFLFTFFVFVTCSVFNRFQRIKFKNYITIFITNLILIPNNFKNILFIKMLIVTKRPF